MRGMYNLRGTELDPMNPETQTKKLKPTPQRTPSPHDGANALQLKKSLFKPKNGKPQTLKP